MRIDKNLLPHQQRLQLLGIDSLETRRIYLTTLFGFKIIANHIDCSDLLAYINFRVPSRNTRLNSLFSVNKSRTDVGRNGVMNRIMQNLNEYIPFDFDFDCTVNTFKRKLKSILVSHP